MNSIWENGAIGMEILSDPQPGWLFDITFLSRHGEDMHEQIKNLVPISIDLPKYETQYVTQMFLGTERSYPINRKYSGDTTLEFYIRVEDENQGIYNFLARLQQNRMAFPHVERDMTFDTIKLTMRDRKLQPTTVYTYINCILTNFEMGQMSYEGEEMIKCSLSYHYDFWTKDNPNEGVAGVSDGVANAIQGSQSAPAPTAKTGAITLNSGKASIVSV
jgi:hypothetical protein